MKLYALAALSLSLCTRAPSPAPVPTSTVEIPIEDAGPIAEPTCLDAYNHQLDLDCPAPEDAHLGWVEFECVPKFTAEQVKCIMRQTVCAAARGCYP